MKYETNLARLEETAKAEGLVLSCVGHNELFIDLDDINDLQPFMQRLHQVHRLFKPIEAAYKRRSKSGKGWHIRVIMSVTLDIRERCAIHCAVGSDPKRELLRLRAIRDGTSDQTSVFLDKPENPEVLLLKWFTGDERKEE